MQILKAILNLTYFTSELDNFLAKFDKTHPNLSESQRKEIQKYKRIFYLRDHPKPAEPAKEFWDEF